jgi:MFS family permease
LRLAHNVTQRSFSNRAVLIVIILSCFLPSFVGSSLVLAAPPIGVELHVPAAELGWLIAAFILCSVTLVLPLGRLGDLTSRKALLIVGFLILAVTSVLIIFVPNFSSLIVLRIIQGVGGACIFATNQAILTDVFPPEQRGRVLGISVAAVYVGLASGPVVGGLLTSSFGWRSPFIFIALWALATAVAACAKLPPNSQKREGSGMADLLARMDIPGCLLYLLATFSLALGLNEIPAWWSWLLIVLGVLLVVVFILYEGRARVPLLAPRVFSAGPNVLLSSFSALLNYAATFAVTYLLSIYLQQVKGFDAGLSGLILITAPLIQALLSPIAGRLSDRYSPFRLASMGMALCGVALFILVFTTEQTPMVQIFVALLIIGAGFALFSSPNTNAVMSEIPRADSGIGISFLTTMRNFGQLASMALIAIIMTTSIGSTSVEQTTPDQIVQIIRSCFIVCIVLSAVGIFTSLNRRTKR